MANEKLSGHLAVAGAYIIFGLNVVCCKDIANSALVSPIVLFTFRALGAAVLFWGLSLFMPREKVDRGDFWKIALASLLGLFLTQFTFLQGITMASAIDAAIMGTLGPIFTMIFAFLFLKEPITWMKAGGGANASTPAGIVLLLLNSLCFALYLALFRPVIAKYNVVTFMKWMFLFSLLMSLPFSAKGLVTTDYSVIPMKVGLEIGYLVFFATFVAYFLIPFGQKRIRPTLVSMYSYMQPILATVLSIILGVDALTWQKILATALVVGGVVLVSKSRAAAR